MIAEYRSLQRLYNILKFFIIGFIIISFFSVLNNGLQLNHYLDLEPNNLGLEQELSTLDIVEMILGIMYMLAFLGIVFFYLRLVYFMYKNTENLGVQNLQHTPASAVWWNFIPFAWYFKPYIIIKEIWKSNDPESPLYDWEKNRVPSLLLIWWVTWCFSNAMGTVIFRLEYNTVAENIYYYKVLVVSDLLDLLAATLLLLVVSKLVERQESKYESMNQISLEV